MSQVDYTCQQCVPGYKLENNQCTFVIQHCAKVDGIICVLCNAGYFATAEGKCAQIPKIINCNVQVDYTCQSCIAGYMLSNNQCNYVIENCEKVKGVVCTQCNTGFYIAQDGKCA